jgi:YD repeat-containing protein
VYDAQDRLTKYGDTAFEYTLKGDLSKRIGVEGTTTYDYDALGALRTVTLPDGRVLEYVFDGRNRRIGKKINGVVVKQWAYGSGLAPLAELDGAV